MLVGRQAPMDWGAISNLQKFETKFASGTALIFDGDLGLNFVIVFPPETAEPVQTESEVGAHTSQELRKAIFRADNPNVSPKYEEKGHGESKCKEGGREIQFGAFVGQPTARKWSRTDDPKAQDVRPNTKRIFLLNRGSCWRRPAR